MKCYLAYFDILGFKDFIYNTSAEAVDFKFECLFRDSQASSTGDILTNSPNGGLMPDFNHCKINCLHISDSIIFWTNEVSETQFLKIVEVCNDFFQSCCVHLTFPVRGCLVKGDISFDPFTVSHQKEFKFINSSLYGKALIEAYLKAEMQDWAGCYVDKTAYDDINQGTINNLISMGKLLSYPVPFKDGSASAELTIKMIGPKRDNIQVGDVENLFTKEINSSIITDNIKRKIDNTIKYFKHIKS